ncbi:molybdopterin-dependent oxidoreductase [Chloroflexota bacterium]
MRGYIIGILLTLVMIVGCTQQQTSVKATYTDVTPTEAKELIEENQDLIIIDVSPNYAQGHLPRAVNYYLGDGSLDKAIPKLDKTKKYLVYCHVDSVAIQGAQKLVDAGFENVYRLKGNYQAWVDAGYQIEVGEPQQGSEALELEPVEIREYEGINLSSTEDFRENSIKGPQQVELDSYTLEISGLVNNSRSYTYEEVISEHELYKKVVTINCVEGWSATILWEGLLIADLLQEAQVLPTANVIIFHAYDGYTTSLPLEFIMENKIILAHKMNEIALPPERGFPFQVVAENKWGYKWAKWVTKIELSDDINYEGFWESRGYSNDADYFGR